MQRMRRMKKMKRNNQISLVLVWLGILCFPAFCGETAPAKSAEPNVWTSIESTIEDLSDPFVPQILKPEPEVVKTDPKPAPAFVPPPVALPPPPPPPPAPEPVLPNMNLVGTIYNTDAPMAIINGQIISIGEKVDMGSDFKGEIKLKAVSEGSVKVVYMGKEFTILVTDKKK
jgi:hypothetical protein